MKHLLLIIIYRVILMAIAVIGGFISAKEDKKHRISEYIATAVVVIFITIVTFPNFKDMIYQETNEIEAVYLECHSESKPFWERTLILKDDDTTYKIVITSLTLLPRRMEKGKTYKIEYYDNSKVLKSCVLIEWVKINIKLIGIAFLWKFILTINRSC